MPLSQSSPVQAQRQGCSIDPDPGAYASRYCLRRQLSGATHRQCTARKCAVGVQQMCRSCAEAAQKQRRSSAIRCVIARPGNGIAVGRSWEMQASRFGYISKLNATSGSASGVAFSSESVTVWCVCTLKFFDAQYAYRVQKIAGIISLHDGNLGSKFHRRSRLPLNVSSTQRTCSHEDL